MPWHEQVASVMGTLVSLDLIAKTYPVSIRIEDLERDVDELAEATMLVRGHNLRVLRFREVSNACLANV
jgi:hypothetical protein